MQEEETEESKAAKKAAAAAQKKKAAHARYMRYFRSVHGGDLRCCVIVERQRERGRDRERGRENAHLDYILCMVCGLRMQKNAAGDSQDGCWGQGRLLGLNLSSSGLEVCLGLLGIQLFSPGIK